jgi:protein TonB
MNMHVSLEERPLDMANLPPFLRTEQKSIFDRDRIIGLAVTAMIHVVVIAAIVFAGISVQRAVAPPPIVVSLDQPKPTKPVDPPKPMPLPAPHVDTVVAPEIAIAPETPTQSIQVEVAPTPTPPAPPAPPAPAATGETQQSYLARLLAYLNRYKHYPPEARSARITGVVMIHFVMDKTGRVTTAEISQSSGKPMLDAEALALMQRAQPLPAIPPDFGKDTINAIVPIEFTLH